MLATVQVRASNRLQPKPFLAEPLMAHLLYPRIADIANEPSGVLRGKVSVAAYWKRALELLPTLRFELIRVYVGSDSLIIHYNGARGPAAEVFFFDQAGLVTRAAANY